MDGRTIESCEYVLLSRRDIITGYLILNRKAEATEARGQFLLTNGMFRCFHKKLRSIIFGNSFFESQLSFLIFIFYRIDIKGFIQSGHDSGHREDTKE